MNKPKFLILHTSDSKWGSVEVIRRWHTDKPPQGRGWNDIGYHYIIENGYPTYSQLKEEKRDVLLNGKICHGRKESDIGAHCVGYNTNSLGICLVGAGGIYTEEQMVSMYSLCMKLMKKYNIPVESILGHCETPKSGGKTCPDLDMKSVRQTLTLLIKVCAR